MTDERLEQLLDGLANATARAIKQIDDERCKDDNAYMVREKMVDSLIELRTCVGLLVLGSRAPKVTP
ncbi:hypothetical protein LCGC14_1498230 [marine sediment metagenome]|uniref:Uncharacterized protein n=1 Tax=marine sediment metagenome TaxID=412755 RepID=A0A0F9J4T3_9ZZZZ